MNFHDPSSSKTLELLNEGIFLLVCYHFVLFVNMLSTHEIKELVGTSAVVFTAFILVMNTSIIVIVSIKALIRKAQKNHAKRLAK